MTTIVSYSEISKWQTCNREYYYRYPLDLTPIENSDAIKVGIKGHRLLQTFHELLQSGKTKEEAIALVRVQAKAIMAESPITDFSLVLAWTLVDNYIRDTDFTSKAILVENRFLVPASLLDPDPVLTDVQIGFTPDVVFERRSKRLDVEDYKFVQRAWPQAKINRFPQAKIYQILLELIGYEISRSTLRFFNVKTSKITDKNYVLEPAERLTLIHDFMSGVKDVVRFKKQSPELMALAPRTMNYNACQYCRHVVICDMQARGKDASNTMKIEFKKSDYDYSK